MVNATSLSCGQPIELDVAIPVPPRILKLETEEKDNVKINTRSNDSTEYVTGFKLALVVASVALACFLMLLDTMVISTVSRSPRLLTS